MLVFKRDQQIKLLQNRHQAIEKIVQQRLSIVDAFYFCNSVAKLIRYREKLDEDLEKAIKIVCNAVLSDFVRNESHQRATL